MSCVENTAHLFIAFYSTTYAELLIIHNRFLINFTLLMVSMTFLLMWNFLYHCIIPTFFDSLVPIRKNIIRNFFPFNIFISNDSIIIVCCTFQFVKDARKFRTFWYIVLLSKEWFRDIDTYDMLAISMLECFIFSIHTR